MWTNLEFDTDKIKPRKFYTIAETVQLLGCSKRAVYYWLHGGLKSKYRGAHIIIEGKDLIRFIWHI